jgi:transposase
MMATVQLRNATDGRAYYDRKKNNGKSSMEAMRCLKRRLSDTVYRTMLADLAPNQTAHQVTGPGAQRGNDSDSSAAGSQPQHRLFGPTPGPVTAHPQPALPKVS